MMKKRIYFVLLALLCCTQAQAKPFGYTGTPVITPKVETVTANLASPSVTIPANYIGIGWNTESFLIWPITPGNGSASLTSLWCMLGPAGYFRTGGASASYTTQLLQNISTLLTTCGSGWIFSYGLTNGESTATSVGWVNAAVSAFGSNAGNIVFNYGNEEGFGGTFQSNWNAAYAAIIAAQPSVKLQANDPSTQQEVADETAEKTFIQGLTPGLAGLQYASRHSYCLDPNGGAVGITQALSICTNNGSKNFQNNLSGSIPVVWDEFAMYLAGGYPGVSDRAEAAAYNLNAYILWAQQGFSGTIMLETSEGTLKNSTGLGRQAPSSPFIQQVDGGWAPAATFYSAFLFSKIVGQQIIPTTNSGTGTVISMATIGAHGNANILVVNNDPQTPVTITPAQSSGSWTTASYLDIEPATANGCFDNQMTAGGAQIGESGAWTGGFRTINIGGTVTIQPCGAVVIEIQP